MNYKERVKPGFRAGLRKHRNAKRGLEFRPVLKAGSTVLTKLIECLQPGEWEVRVYTCNPSPWATPPP